MIYYSKLISIPDILPLENKDNKKATINEPMI